MAEKHRKLIKRNCIKCGKEFGARPYDVMKGWGKTCSKECANFLRAWKGGVKPIIQKAGNKVNYAIKKGELNREPCEVCGNEKVEAHHCDYTKPLDVMWLCRKHHNEWHRENEPNYY